ncbi:MULTISPECIES: efflux RND transporter permease subunit [Acinetobacter calcoaceticus/baumannii complex]|uniref:efflux RND transporter permease subunit n=1 Tax=Acinetobacter calcoaceticus/baumannii complex TaxID=909768 RepID=UPI0004BC711F|nr:MULTISPECIES: CusA/CzcA family heavy metal efflux RND transporter [Acinetobacter calcoaceticus/baumannii complex]MBJ9723780.1 CusA/CzcA family heavy metal efflux RND transporter [Acinetobacter nosocomialis]MBP1460821.1 CusA/CzcA family heavy metal efflux RND transporter [Acinetobacter nosocomialis]MBP1489542.1 CusA/CzcA family heavy metal efflux RND transporter [Acinetobacter nosocomialis]MDB0100480.1 CusA/CzcA family heavy metal efflux RND transporter [Acinetobacter nosocomialis]MDB0103186
MDINKPDLPAAEGLFDRIIQFSINNAIWVMMFVIAWIGVGIYSYQKLSIDAVPDITNVQVQINSQANGFTAPEVEQRITYPIENAMSGIPNLEQTRSISRYGLSQVTIIFKDGTDIYWARQLINQRLQEAKSALPDSIDPQMSPISTGLGEIYQWVVKAEPNAKKADGSAYSAMDLREIQDWIIRPQLQRVQGVAEVNSIGGYNKTYVVSPDLTRLQQLQIPLTDLQDALQNNNENRGAGFIEENGQQLTVRVPGMLTSIQDIQNVTVATKNGLPIRVADVASVSIGHDLRTGGATYNGQETVLGIAMMMMGENSKTIAKAIDQKVQEIQRSLPQGVVIETVYDRSSLVDKAIKTVAKNLIEGAILVIVILFIFLGNFRAALITACIIPLAMLFTLTGMAEQKISANLMSLGALDFGIIVDGAVVIVENCIRRLAEAQHLKGRLLTRSERFTEVFLAAKQARRPLIFGQIIIMVVYLPIFALAGVEAKMFHPMAMTVVLALLGAIILSVTFVPAAVALFVTGEVKEKESRWMMTLKKGYAGLLDKAYAFRYVVVTAAVSILILTSAIATRVGSEFAPQLSEGDFALQLMRAPSTGIEESLKIQENVEKQLLKAFPEIKAIFARTGTAEVATDVMPPNISDGIVLLKPHDQWPNPKETIDELRARMLQFVNQIPGNNSEFSQPIELRFNELISGVRSDIGVKIFGDDMQVLNQEAEKIAQQLRSIPGASEVKVEQTDGLPLLNVDVDHALAAQYGLSVKSIQDIVAASIGGQSVGQILQGDRRFDFVIRLQENMRTPQQLAQLPIRLPNGGLIQLQDVAKVENILGLAQVSRENGKRRVIVTANVRDRDLGSFVQEMQGKLAQQKLPSGYWLGYGGQFENLASATARMQIVVPMALIMIFVLLMAVFSNFKDSLLVFSGVPFALSGGLVALWLRDIPLSMSAGVGFIALSGVAVLNGLVMLTFIKELRTTLDVHAATWKGAVLRLRPVLMTAFVASLGFIPMALATGTGAEVQRPLATVVIGGIISSTILTLVLLPVIYRWMNESKAKSAEHS